MKKPQIYFIDGSVVADKGIHLFKNVVCLYGSDISKLEEVADVIKLKTDDKGIYCLQEEGCGSDSGEKYLIASGSISTCGLESIVSILSPVYSYKNYVEGIQGIRDILNKINGDTEINRTLLRLLFIGVCGEFEGYLHSTIIALIQGCKDAFITLRECKGLPSESSDELQWRDDIVDKINNRFQFQHIRTKDSKEREIYERLIGEPLIISQELRDNIEWRNKLAHKVPFYNKQSIFPSKEEILNFIAETDKVVNLIDSRIYNFKSEWLNEF